MEAQNLLDNLIFLNLSVKRSPKYQADVSLNDDFSSKIITSVNASD